MLTVAARRGRRSRLKIKQQPDGRSCTSCSSLAEQQQQPPALRETQQQPEHAPAPHDWQQQPQRASALSDGHGGCFVTPRGVGTPSTAGPQNAVTCFSSSSAAAFSRVAAAPAPERSTPVCPAAHMCAAAAVSDAAAGPSRPAAGSRRPLPAALPSPATASPIGCSVPSVFPHGALPGSAAGRSRRRDDSSKSSGNTRRSATAEKAAASPRCLGCEGGVARCACSDKSGCTTRVEGSSDSSRWQISDAAEWARLRSSTPAAGRCVGPTLSEDPCISDFLFSSVSCGTPGTAGSAAPAVGGAGGAPTATGNTAAVAAALTSAAAGAAEEVTAATVGRVQLPLLFSLLQRVALGSDGFCCSCFRAVLYPLLLGCCCPSLPALGLLSYLRARQLLLQQHQKGNQAEEASDESSRSLLLQQRAGRSCVCEGEQRQRSAPQQRGEVQQQQQELQKQDKQQQKRIQEHLPTQQQVQHPEGQHEQPVDQQEQQQSHLQPQVEQEMDTRREQQLVQHRFRRCALLGLLHHVGGFSRERHPKQHEHEQQQQQEQGRDWQHQQYGPVQQQQQEGEEQLQWHEQQQKQPSVGMELLRLRRIEELLDRLQRPLGDAEGCALLQTLTLSLRHELHSSEAAAEDRRIVYSSSKSDAAASSAPHGSSGSMTNSGSPRRCRFLNTSSSSAASSSCKGMSDGSPASSRRTRSSGSSGRSGETTGESAIEERQEKFDAAGQRASPSLRRRDNSAEAGGPCATAAAPPVAPATYRVAGRRHAAASSERPAAAVVARAEAGALDMLKFWGVRLCAVDSRPLSQPAATARARAHRDGGRQQQGKSPGMPPEKTDARLNRSGKEVERRTCVSSGASSSVARRRSASRSSSRSSNVSYRSASAHRSTDNSTTLSSSAIASCAQKRSSTGGVLSSSGSSGTCGRSRNRPSSRRRRTFGTRDGSNSPNSTVRRDNGGSASSPAAAKSLDPSWEEEGAVLEGTSEAEQIDKDVARSLQQWELPSAGVRQPEHSSSRRRQSSSRSRRRNDSSNTMPQDSVSLTRREAVSCGKVGREEEAAAAAACMDEGASGAPSAADVDLEATYTTEARETTAATREAPPPVGEAAAAACRRATGEAAGETGSAEPADATCLRGLLRSVLYSLMARHRHRLFYTQGMHDVAAALLLLFMEAGRYALAGVQQLEETRESAWCTYTPRSRRAFSEGLLNAGGGEAALEADAAVPAAAARRVAGRKITGAASDAAAVHTRSLDPAGAAAAAAALGAATAEIPSTGRTTPTRPHAAAGAASSAASKSVAVNAAVEATAAATLETSCRVAPAPEATSAAAAGGSATGTAVASAPAADASSASSDFAATLFAGRTATSRRRVHPAAAGAGRDKRTACSPYLASASVPTFVVLIESYPALTHHLSHVAFALTERIFLFFLCDFFAASLEASLLPALALLSQLLRQIDPPLHAVLLLAAPLPYVGRSDTGRSSSTPCVRGGSSGRVCGSVCGVAQGEAGEGEKTEDEEEEEELLGASAGAELHACASWLITLFAHSFSSFSSLCRVLDCILSSPPLFALHLAAALIQQQRTRFFAALGAALLTPRFHESPPPAVLQLLRDAKPVLLHKQKQRRRLEGEQQQDQQQQQNQQQEQLQQLKRQQQHQGREKDRERHREEEGEQQEDRAPFQQQTRVRRGVSRKQEQQQNQQEAQEWQQSKQAGVETEGGDEKAKKEEEGVEYEQDSVLLEEPLSEPSAAGVEAQLHTNREEQHFCAAQVKQAPAACDVVVTAAEGAVAVSGSCSTEAEEGAALRRRSGANSREADNRGKFGGDTSNESEDGTAANSISDEHAAKIQTAAPVLCDSSSDSAAHSIDSCLMAQEGERMAWLLTARGKDLRLLQQRHCAAPLGAALLRCLQSCVGEEMLISLHAILQGIDFRTLPLEQLLRRAYRTIAAAAPAGRSTSNNERNGRQPAGDEAPTEQLAQQQHIEERGDWQQRPKQQLDVRKKVPHQICLPPFSPVYHYPFPWMVAAAEMPAAAPEKGRPSCNAAAAVLDPSAAATEVTLSPPTAAAENGSPAAAGRAAVDTKTRAAAIRRARAAADGMAVGSAGDANVTNRDSIDRRTVPVAGRAAAASAAAGTERSVAADVRDAAAARKEVVRAGGSSPAAAALPEAHASACSGSSASVKGDCSTRSEETRQLSPVGSAAAARQTVVGSSSCCSGSREDFFMIQKAPRATNKEGTSAQRSASNSAAAAAAELAVSAPASGGSAGEALADFFASAGERCAAEEAPGAATMPCAVPVAMRPPAAAANFFCSAAACGARCSAVSLLYPPHVRLHLQEKLQEEEEKEPMLLPTFPPVKQQQQQYATLERSGGGTQLEELRSEEEKHARLQQQLRMRSAVQGKKQAQQARPEEILQQQQLGEKSQMLCQTQGQQEAGFHSKGVQQKVDGEAATQTAAAYCGEKGRLTAIPPLYLFVPVYSSNERSCRGGATSGSSRSSGGTVKRKEGVPRATTGNKEYPSAWQYICEDGSLLPASPQAFTAAGGVAAAGAGATPARGAAAENRSPRAVYAFLSRVPPLVPQLLLLLQAAVLRLQPALLRSRVFLCDRRRRTTSLLNALAVAGHLGRQQRYTSAWGRSVAAAVHRWWRGQQQQRRHLRDSDAWRRQPQQHQQQQQQRQQDAHQPQHEVQEEQEEGREGQQRQGQQQRHKQPQQEQQQRQRQQAQRQKQQQQRQHEQKQQEEQQQERQQQEKRQRNSPVGCYRPLLEVGQKKQQVQQQRQQQHRRGRRQQQGRRQAWLSRRQKKSETLDRKRTRDAARREGCVKNTWWDFTSAYLKPKGRMDNLVLAAGGVLMAVLALLLRQYVS